MSDVCAAEPELIAGQVADRHDNLDATPQNKNMSNSKLLVRGPGRPLRGIVSVPGDKSISHRGVMLASIANGRSIIRNWLPAGDTLATLEAMRSLGVPIETEARSAQAWELRIAGRGKEGLRAAGQPIDCRNAGTCMRLLAGLLAGQRFPTLLDGSEQLRRRPMRRIILPLSEMGANIEADAWHAPLMIGPGRLHGITYRMNVASAQVKSAILLAGLYADGETRVYQPGPARDHTERMLSAMGVTLATTADSVSIRGGQRLAPLDMTLPGDISSAAYLAVAAAIVPGSRITVSNSGYNDTRTGILDMLAAMGAGHELERQRMVGGEPAADLTFHAADMGGTSVGGDTVVRGIDELPIWTVAATQATGESTLRDAAELRVKEVDRISVLAGELGKMGAKIVEHADGFSVAGPVQLQAAEVHSHGDHRLAMALAMAGLVADGTTIVHDAGCVSDSFPGFVETVQRLGADIAWLD